MSFSACNSLKPLINMYQFNEVLNSYRNARRQLFPLPWQLLERVNFINKKSVNPSDYYLDVPSKMIFNFSLNHWQFLLRSQQSLLPFVQKNTYAFSLTTQPSTHHTSKAWWLQFSSSNQIDDQVSIIKSMCGPDQFVGPSQLIARGSVVQGPKSGMSLQLRILSITRLLFWKLNLPKKMQQLVKLKPFLLMHSNLILKKQYFMSCLDLSFKMQLIHPLISTALKDVYQLFLILIKKASIDFRLLQHLPFQGLLKARQLAVDNWPLASSDLIQFWKNQWTLTNLQFKVSEKWLLKCQKQVCQFLCKFGKQGISPACQLIQQSFKGVVLGKFQLLQVSLKKQNIKENRLQLLQQNLGNLIRVGIPFQSAQNQSLKRGRSSESSRSLYSKSSRSSFTSSHSVSHSSSQQPVRRKFEKREQNKYQSVRKQSQQRSRSIFSTQQVSALNETRGRNFFDYDESQYKRFRRAFDRQKSEKKDFVRESSKPKAIKQEINY